MGDIGVSTPRVVVTGGGATRRWWVAERSLAGLLARGPFHSAQDALRAAERPDRARSPIGKVPNLSPNG